ncbi:hypothetical protein BC831DRAFT_472018 [Entophlyctis helioformis]|nr:hypothetical protein BC831DRAFT_472018 [Entophlyctis helioformis]
MVKTTQASSTSAPPMPFDPTVYDPMEADRFRKLKWLPPLADTARVARLVVPKRRDPYIYTREPAHKNSKAGSDAKAFKAKGGDRFPLDDILESTAWKKRLMVNPRTRFMLQLSDVAKTRRRFEDFIQGNSEMNASAVDWGLVKTLSKEAKFCRYIGQLERRGLERKSSSEEMDQDGSADSAERKTGGNGQDGSDGDDDAGAGDGGGDGGEPRRSGRGAGSPSKGAGTSNWQSKPGSQRGRGAGGAPSPPTSMMAGGMTSSKPPLSMSRSGRYTTSQQASSRGTPSHAGNGGGGGGKKKHKDGSRGHGASSMAHGDHGAGAGGGVTGANGATLRKRNDSLHNMREYIDGSVFRPKRKGELAIRRYTEEIETDHSYGRPAELKDNEGDEFNRTFKEMYGLGETVKEKVVQMKIDKENFNIPRTIAAAIEAVQHEAVQQRLSRRAASKSGAAGQSGARQESPTTVAHTEFLQSRKMLHKALTDTLEERKQDRLLATESVDTALPIIDMVVSDARKHARASKSQSGPAWESVVPYLWFKDAADLVKADKVARETEARFAMPPIAHGLQAGPGTSGLPPPPSSSSAAAAAAAAAAGGVGGSSGAGVPTQFAPLPSGFANTRGHRLSCFAKSGLDPSNMAAGALSGARRDKGMHGQGSGLGSSGTPAGLIGGPASAASALIATPSGPSAGIGASVGASATAGGQGMSGSTSISGGVNAGGGGGGGGGGGLADRPDDIAVVRDMFAAAWRERKIGEVSELASMVGMPGFNPLQMPVLGGHGSTGHGHVSALAFPPIDPSGRRGTIRQSVRFY